MTLTAEADVTQMTLLAERITAADIVDALRRRHRPKYNGNTPDWVTFTELSTRPSFNPGRIDVWAMNCTVSRRAMIAYEIKVSRSDFLHELAHPEKRLAAVRYSTEFFFASPAGLISPMEVPDEAGLIEYRDRRLIVTKPAPKRECQPPPWDFVGCITRKAFREPAV